MLGVFLPLETTQRCRRKRSFFSYSPSTTYSKNKERQRSGLQCGHLSHSPGWSATVAMFVRHALLLTGL